MRPEIVAPAIARAAARIAERAPRVESERERLSADLAAVTAELERLTDALSRGGGPPSLLAAIQARKARRREVRDALTRVTPPITSPLVGCRILRARDKPYVSGSASGTGSWGGITVEA